MPPLVEGVSVVAEADACSISRADGPHAATSARTSNPSTAACTRPRLMANSALPLCGGSGCYTRGLFLEAADHHAAAAVILQAKGLGVVGHGEAEPLVEADRRGVLVVD